MYGTRLHEVPQLYYIFIVNAQNSVSGPVRSNIRQQVNSRYKLEDLGDKQISYVTAQISVAISWVLTSSPPKDV